MKKYTGKPRPDFLGRCYGSLTNMPLVEEDGQPCDPARAGCEAIWDEVPEILTDEFCLERREEAGVETDPDEFAELMKDGRVSFPSAHAGTSAVGGLWCSMIALYYLSFFDWGKPLGQV